MTRDEFERRLALEELRLKTAVDIVKASEHQTGSALDAKKHIAFSTWLLGGGIACCVLAYLHRLLWAACAATGTAFSMQFAYFAEWATWSFAVIGVMCTLIGGLQRAEGL